MIQEILLNMFKNNILLYVITGFCMVGILGKVMLAIAYSKLIKASDQMSNSEHKLMKLMRLKFETCYKLKIGVHNIDTFIDKYIYKYRFCGILLHTWENISGVLAAMCMLTGTVGGILAAIYQLDRNVILFHLFTGIFTGALLIILDNILNLNTKRKVIRTNIRDYLENFLKIRLEKELGEQLDVKERIEKNLEEKNPTQKEVAVTEEEFYESPKSVKPAPVIRPKRSKRALELDPKEEKIIEDILREYLN